ncbi:MAG: hypothetical protein O3C52_10080 [Proteobacteria bacterium]|nr:hypothetical protein [Pseudomonadota bacterium]MDA0914762.1 hypothetical protein [Pseudomonadota bacterium]MDA1033691.1 hypothetical protein [Pseudomonadota bacterium]
MRNVADWGAFRSFSFHFATVCFHPPFLDWSNGRPSLASSPASIYDRQILRLALLAPDLQTDILAGRQPPTLTLEALKTIAIPVCWKAQREALGWNR